MFIVECSDGSYYTGFSNNPFRRVDEHNEGLDTGCYTYKRRPVKFVYSRAFTDPVEGIAFEKQLKGWSRKKRKALIDNNIELLKEFSRSYSCNSKTLRQAQRDILF